MPFTRYCAACHGADQRGADSGRARRSSASPTASTPKSLRVIVTEGRNNMRPILDATNEDIRGDLHLSQLDESERSGRSAVAAVVQRLAAAASAGAGRRQRRRAASAAAARATAARSIPGVGGTAGNMPWPEDVEAAKLPTRYQTGYNVMATATKPPYTTITAYDLNTGEIKWQVPNGDDPATVDHFGKGDGPHDTGGVGARNGMVVTRTGLLFQNGKDGWARAYDVETGKVLWKGKTAGQSIGIPTMYESKGRQYVVFMSPPAGRCGRRRRGRRHRQRAARRPARTATSRSRFRSDDQVTARTRRQAEGRYASRTGGLVLTIVSVAAVSIGRGRPSGANVHP